MSGRIDTEEVTTVQDIVKILDALFHLMPDETIDILVDKEPSIAGFFKNCEE